MAVPQNTGVISNMGLRVIQYVTQKSDDGIGHQLAGMFSCMVVDQLDVTTTFVKKRYVSAQHEKSPYAERLFEYLQEDYPEQPENVKIHFVDNCWSHVRTLCAAGRTKCSHAKQQISLKWHKQVKALSSSLPELNPADSDVAVVHKRGGDMLKYQPDILFRYDDAIINTVSYLHKTFSLRTEIHVETDKDKEMLINASHFNSSFCSIVSGGDAVKLWIHMVKARVLFLSSSSFSISASLARSNLPTISASSHPNEGRYDDNFLPCALDTDFDSRRTEPLEPAVYFDNGHGSLSCQPLEESLNNLFR
jgi:hypothetical protein